MAKDCSLINFNLPMKSRFPARALGASSSAACISIAAANRHGPQLVIANIIENTFGGEEAARYAIALATRKAQ